MNKRIAMRVRAVSRSEPSIKEVLERQEEMWLLIGLKLAAARVPKVVFIEGKAAGFAV